MQQENATGWRPNSVHFYVIPPKQSSLWPVTGRGQDVVDTWREKLDLRTVGSTITWICDCVAFFCCSVYRLVVYFGLLANCHYLLLP